MSVQPQDGEKPSIASLLAGLVNDIKDLFGQELKLARKEIAEDIRKTRAALTALGIGLVILTVSLGLLLLMVVHLINAMTNIPLWGCYGIVGVVVAVIGIVFLILGKSKTQEVDFKPEQTVQAVKEDVGWIRARMRSSRIGRERAPLSLRR
jgi:uncharacterized membrane protein YqjE